MMLITDKIYASIIIQIISKMEFKFDFITFSYIIKLKVLEDIF